jgi:hypothetical protein
MGGFRTPAHAKTRRMRWPASENLHHACPSAERAVVSKADMLAGEASDAELNGNLPFIRPGLNGEVVPFLDT